MDPQVSMSNKMKADYTELVNSCLDRIPVRNAGDFPKIVEALKSIIDPENKHEVASELTDNIVGLNELLEFPQMYAKSEHIKEFKAIVMSRVAGKVKEISNLTPQQQSAYISERQAKEKEVKEKREKMAGHVPPQPGSEAYVISEQEMLLDLQNRILPMMDNQRNSGNAQGSQLNNRLQPSQNNLFPVLELSPTELQNNLMQRLSIFAERQVQRMASQARLNELAVIASSPQGLTQAQAAERDALTAQILEFDQNSMNEMFEIQMQMNQLVQPNPNTGLASDEAFVRNNLQNWASRMSRQ